MKSIAVVKTAPKLYQPPYFFGDHLGVLTWNNGHRICETIEVSVNFEEEEEEKGGEGKEEEQEKEEKPGINQYHSAK